MRKACQISVLVALLGSVPLLAAEPCQSLPIIAGEPSAPSIQSVRNTLTAASLNLAEEVDVEKIIRDLGDADPIHQADLLLLQEVVGSSQGHQNLPARLAGRLGFHFAFAPGDTLEGGLIRGVAILSRFALRDAVSDQLKHFELGFKSRCRVALAVTVDSPWGQIRAVNVHLDSRINSDERLAQLEPIVAKLAQFDGPRLIGGDFNTANVRWMTRFLPIPYLDSQGDDLRKMMESIGFSTPFVSTGRTFSYLPLRLDWIYLKGLEALDVGVEPMPFSDHRGIWVKLQNAPRQLD